MNKTVYWTDLGRSPYAQAFAFQHRLHAARCKDKIPDVLLFQENEPTITVGRDAQQASLLYSREDYQKMGICVEDVSRGGDVSVHMPGQLVLSVIADFKACTPSAVTFVRLLEQTVIDMLDTYNLEGTRIKGLSGVWTKHPATGELAKIAALGLEINHGITQHGMSLNINPDMRLFERIIPCGISDRDVVAMAAFGKTPVFSEVRDRLIQSFTSVFHTTAQMMPPALVKELKQ